MSNRSFLWVFAAFAGVSCISAARAQVELFTDFAKWQAAAGSFSTVDFTGFPVGTFITDQYADLGVLFTDGNDSIHFAGSFTIDGAGLDGNGDTVVAFAEPMVALAIHFPGFAQVELFVKSRSIYLSEVISGPGAFDLGFLGVISTLPFDSAALIDPIGEVAIENLYFGPPIPSPGTLTALALGLLLRATRRRC